MTRLLTAPFERVIWEAVLTTKTMQVVNKHRINYVSIFIVLVFGLMSGVCVLLFGDMNPG